MHTPNHILAADMVIWLEDIRPNVDIAKAGIAVGKAGLLKWMIYGNKHTGYICPGNCINN